MLRSLRPAAMLGAALALLALSAPILAAAQDTAVPRYKRADGQLSFGQGVQVLGSDGNPLPGGRPLNPTTIYSAQKTCAVTAAALTAHALVNGVVLSSLSTNTGTVYVGPSGVTVSTGYPLVPGEKISYGVTNTSAVFIICTNATDVVAVTGN